MPVTNVTDALLKGTLICNEQGNRFTGSVEHAGEIPPPGGGGGGGGGGASAVDEAVRQNTQGNSEATPAGVPHDYSWYHGKNANQLVPPDGYKAVAGWGQIYPEEYQSIVAGNCLIQKFQTWVLLKTGVWVSAQDQSKSQHQIDGAHYNSDFSENANVPWEQHVNPDGSVTVDAPIEGYNDHYWPGQRGTYKPGSVAGVFTMSEVKAENANMRFVVNIGADWWPDQSGELPPGVEYNPGVGMCNWIKLSTDWRRSYYYSITTDEFKDNPPPPLK